MGSLHQSAKSFHLSPPIFEPSSTKSERRHDISCIITFLHVSHSATAWQEWKVQINVPIGHKLSHNALFLVSQWAGVSYVSHMPLEECPHLLPRGTHLGLLLEPCKKGFGKTCSHLQLPEHLIVQGYILSILPIFTAWIFLLIIRMNSWILLIAICHKYNEWVSLVWLEPYIALGKTVRKSVTGVINKQN